MLSDRWEVTSRKDVVVNETAVCQHATLFRGFYLATTYSSPLEYA
ncbi:hypothetical protein JMJ77_0013903, partial [Colletotrichum scovillei]